MSHYAVNASVPKTLIAYVIRWVAQNVTLGRETTDALFPILATKFSPELVPAQSETEEPSQDTQATIGPFELQDFHLHQILRFGYAPPKVAFLCYCAWHDRESGAWPDIPAEERRQYDIRQIRENLRIFLTRFFKLSQFKRTCIPNAPKVGSGGSLSPRGDYRAPSDSEVVAWLAELELVPEEDTRLADSNRRETR
jgi:NAD+ synthase (glutamine-hydrolysing)